MGSRRERRRDIIQRRSRKFLKGARRTIGPEHHPAPLLRISPSKLELTRRQAAAALELLIAARFVIDHPHSTKALRLLRKKCTDLLPVFPEDSETEPLRALRCSDCGVTSLNSHEQHAATCARVQEFVSVGS